MSAVLIEGEEFTPKLGGPTSWGDNVFRYCHFNQLDIDGVSFEGMMTRCTLSGLKLYWGFFNTALLDHVRFERCIFPGTSFRGCSLVECTFESCEFVLDNLGGDCTIDDCLIAACTFINCRFDHAGPERNTIFGKNRVFGSTQRGCVGIESLIHDKRH